MFHFMRYLNAVSQLRSHLISGFKEAQFLYVSLKKEFSEQQSDR